MKFVNLTAHEINDMGAKKSYLPSGVVARTDRGVKETYYHSTLVAETTYSQVFGVPDPEPDTMYIVSAVVLNALDGTRPDCVSPFRPIRDSSGKTIGCLGFRVN